MCVVYGVSYSPLNEQPHHSIPTSPKPNLQTTLAAVEAFKQSTDPTQSTPIPPQPIPQQQQELVKPPPEQAQRIEAQRVLTTEDFATIRRLKAKVWVWSCVYICACLGLVCLVCLSCHSETDGEPCAAYPSRSNVGWVGRTKPSHSHFTHNSYHNPPSPKHSTRRPGGTRGA